MNDDEPEHTRAPIWLVTFGDVVALLLTFFVMLYATAKIPSENWDAVVGTLSKSLRFSPSGMAPNPQTNLSIPIVQVAPALSTDYLSNILRNQLKQDDLLNKAEVLSQDKRVAVTFTTGNMFAPGKATLDPEMQAAVSRLGGVFVNIPNQLEVRGHAGRSAAEGADFEANQKLSLERAETVAALLRKTGYQRNIIVLGLGDSRYKHLDPVLSSSRREALSRRVDFVIHASAENQ